MVLLRSLRRRRLRDRRTVDAFKVVVISTERPNLTSGPFCVAMETMAMCVRLLADSGGIEASLIYARHRMADR